MTKRGDKMKQLYVCSGPVLEDGNLRRHLLGILSQYENGEYSFEYRLGNKADTDRLLLPIFPDKNKTYETRECHLLLDDYLPSENDTAFIKSILDKTGMEEYDEWEWLKTFESDDESDTKLYETLPDDIIRHDINDEISDNQEDVETDDEFDEFDEFDNFVNLDDFDEIEFEDVDFDDEKPIVETTSYDDSILNSQKTETISDISDNDFDDDFEALFDEFEDFDNFDELESDDFDKSETNDDAQNKQAHVSTVIVTTKTVTTKVKKSKNPNNFISPPPTNPFDELQKKLEQNTIQRQKKLEQLLKSNTNSTNS